MPCNVTPKRVPVSTAAASAASMPLRLDRNTSAPAPAAITPAMRPTGPVPPRITTRCPASACAWWRCNADSTHASIAAAVVYAPLGSAISETTNGLTIDAFERSSMSAASSASRPPMKMPVRDTPFGPREKTVSCVSPPIASGPTSQYGTMIW